MTRRILFAFVLALILPFAQLAAAAHEVTHVKAAPVTIHCDQCVAGAAVGAGAAAADAAAAAPVAYDTPLSWHTPAPRTAEPTASFLSRAPPSTR
ncbi:MAG TPA: hypothetical protein VMZ74_07480 [Ramlibacter sp.]|nr:hypothetical protein [Ramlibacter sp.]